MLSEGREGVIARPTEESRGGVEASGPVVRS